MKKNLLFIAGILLSSSVIAQEIKITNGDIVKNNGTVTVSFTTDVAKLKSNERLTLTPVVYNGAQSQSLKPIIITGRSRAISDQRTGLNNAAAKRATKKVHVPYQATFPYQSWMGELSLRLDRKIMSCCDEQTLSPLGVVASKLIHYDVVMEPLEPIAQELSPTQKLDAESAFLHPSSDYDSIKKNIDELRTQGAPKVYFKQGGTVINPSLGQNQKTLDKIKEILRVIESDPQATLEKIVLAGASSPEGSTQINDMLSKKRAEALKQYIGANAISKANIFEMIPVGEDWTGLRQMVEKSDMQYRSEVLEIIDKYQIKQGRENHLIDLQRGRPYNYMLEHFFPELRNAGYISIFYNVKPSPYFVNTNEAIELYNQKSYAEALNCLEGVTPTAITEYMRGGCHMMLGDYAAAEASLQKAITLGSTDATKQLEQLYKLQQINK